MITQIVKTANDGLKTDPGWNGLGLWALTTIDWDWFRFALLRVVKTSIILVSSSTWLYLVTVAQGKPWAFSFSLRFYLFYTRISLKIKQKRGKIAMKKILSLALAGVMMFSALPMAYAADVDAAQGTSVTVVGKGGEWMPRPEQVTAVGARNQPFSQRGLLFAPH